MQKEQRQILQLIEGKIGDNEQFAYECRIKEIEWNMAKELKNYRKILLIKEGNYYQEIRQKKENLISRCWNIYSNYDYLRIFCRRQSSFSRKRSKAV